MTPFLTAGKCWKNSCLLRCRFGCGTEMQRGVPSPWLSICFGSKAHVCTQPSTAHKHLAQSEDVGVCVFVHPWLSKIGPPFFSCLFPSNPSRAVPSPSPTSECTASRPSARSSTRPRPVFSPLVDRNRLSFLTRRRGMSGLFNVKKQFSPHLADLIDP